MRFVIVGTGRCGTGYLARALSALGVPCGHEAVHDHDEATSGTGHRWASWEGDSSLAAAGYLHLLRGDSPVVHVVRHPLHVLRSWLGDHFFADACPCHDPGEHLRTPYVAWMARQLPDDFADVDDELGRAIAWTARWNAHCAAEPARLGLPYTLVRVEDLTARVPLADLAGRLGSPYEPAECRLRAGDVIERLGTRVNAHRRGRLTCDDVAAHPLGDEVVTLADDYGYGW